MAPYRLSEISDQSLTINYQTWICQSSVGMETFSSCARVREMVTETSTKMDAGERSPVGSTGSWHWTKTVLVVNSKTKRWNSLKYSTEQKGELNCGVADAELSEGLSPWLTPLTSHKVLWSVGHVINFNVIWHNPKLGSLISYFQAHPKSIRQESSSTLLSGPREMFRFHHSL